jgi:hypothetical protein
MIVDHRWELAKDVRVPGYLAVSGVNIIQRLGDYVDLKDSRNFWNGEPVYVNVRITETLQTSGTVPKSVFLLLASRNQYADGSVGDQLMTNAYYNGLAELSVIGQTGIINSFTFAGTSFVFPVSRPHMTYRYQEQYGSPLALGIDAHDLRYLSVAHLYDYTSAAGAEWNQSGKVTVSLSLEGADVPRTYPASTST